MDADRQALVLLVLDDDRTARRIAELAGLGGGPELVRAERLAEHAALRGRSPDCLLVAFGPGEADATRLRELHGRVPDAALVVLLAERDERLVLEATEAGAQDSLVLDELDRRGLERAVRYAIERAKALRTVRHLHESDLRAAEKGRLERGLLPRPLLRDEQLRCVTLYQPGLDQALLGGDFYDVVERDDGTVLALVGDVAGRGAEQAALGIRLRVAWRTLALAHLAHVDTFSALEELLLAERHDPEAFVTCCELAIAPDRSHAIARSAGHPPPLVCDGTDVRVAPVPPGPPLGIPGAAAHPRFRIDLAGVRAILCCTDGLVIGFAEPHRRERLGIDGLREVAAAECHGAHDLGELVGEVLRSVQARNGGLLVDDVAMLAIGFGAHEWRREARRSRTPA